MVWPFGSAAQVKCLFDLRDTENPVPFAMCAEMKGGAGTLGGLTKRRFELIHVVLE